MSSTLWCPGWCCHEHQIFKGVQAGAFMSTRLLATLADVYFLFCRVLGGAAHRRREQPVC
eukprot:scaffold59156_cov20-Tisochrysis_lutea.AAC.2